MSLVMETRNENCERVTVSDLKLKELETSFINSPIVAPFCVSWSKDNRISVLAEGGVFVLELWPTPLSDQQSVSFSKFWIPANSSTPLSKAVVENDNNTFLWSLNKEQVYEITLDSTLSHAVQKPNGNTSSSHVILCEFSPLIGGKSYISCLTNNGLLEICKKSLKKWVSVMNVTQLWITHCSFNENSTAVNYESFKSRMLRLKISAMKWVDVPEILFLTAHDNGEIVLWKVDVLNDNFFMSVKHCVKINGKPVFVNVHGKPNAENCFLFVGVLSGIVKCLSVELKSGTITQEFNLWKYEDSLMPSRIISQKIFNKLFVFVVKRHILLIQALSCDESSLQNDSDPYYEEFPTAITALNEYQDSFIICLQNHDTYVLKIKYTNNKIFCDKKIIDTGIKKKQKSLYSCYGLAMSQNKALWILTSSPKVNYNSLKDMTHLIIFSPEEKIFKSLIDKTSSGLIEKIVKEYKFIHLNEIFDLLMLKKLELLSNVSKFKEDYAVNEDLYPVDLQLMLWEVELKLFCNLMDSDSIVGDVEFAISKSRAKKMVDTLRKSDSLSSLQKKSLEMCEMFLMNNKEKSKSLDEVCPICGSESFLYSVRVSSCPNFHKFPRCCLSLLPCDTVPYAICGNCESVALTHFVVEGDNRCPYCDGLLELDTRF